MDRQQLQNLWQQTLHRIGAEVALLDGHEQASIAARLAEVAALQMRLHAFFAQADGAAQCTACQGACCARGTHHLTLVNLLGYLLAHEAPPAPDFSRTCPFLDVDGCRLDVARRPYNCITFLCEAIEARLSPPEVAEFYHLERQLRAIYLDFDQRYAGSSLRGLLIRAERLGEGAFLARVQGSI